MADPLDLLQEMRDRLLSLPEQVAEMVRFELSTPSRQEEAGAPAIAAQAVADVGAAIAPEMEGVVGSLAGGGDRSPFELPEPVGVTPPGGFEAEGTAAPSPGGFDSAPGEGPVSPAPFDVAGAESPRPEREELAEGVGAPPGGGETPEGTTAPLPEYPDLESAEAPQPEYPDLESAESPTPEFPEFEAVAAPAPDYEVPAPGEDGQADVMSLLQEVASSVAQLRQGGGGGHGGLGRRPPPPQGVATVAVWEAPPEGFAGGASPSLNVSSIAGAGGASSRRGYGSGVTTGARYFNPEGDPGVPR